MKKIMFNDKYGLTEAVLNGKKTQTRRLVPNGTPIGNWAETEAHANFKVGEVVAVAQSYKSVGDEVGLSFFIKDKYKKSAGMTNKMFVKAELMPHHIRITNIRIERLQDISEDDCLAEGIEKIGSFYHFKDTKNDEWEHYAKPRSAFHALIDKVSCKGTWNSNPYVFVYDFELVD